MAFWDDIVNKLSQTWPARMGQGILGAAALPGDVYAGRTDPGSNEAIGRAADLAGILGGSAFVAPAQRNAVGAGIRAYHGSPYDFAKFDLSKIGTGEGAQAYGHGLYFAENPAVAADYKGKLTRQANVSNSPEANNALYYLQRNNFDKTAARAEMESALGMKLPDTHSAVEAINNYNPGKMYEVNINAKPEQFLDFDKPVSQQPEGLKRAYDKAGLDITAPNGEEAYMRLAKHLSSMKEASNTFSDLGIPGIRYLDQGSRGAILKPELQQIQRQLEDYQYALNSGNIHPEAVPGYKSAIAGLQAELQKALGQPPATSNYVVFNSEIVDILKKYGLIGALGASQLTPQGNEQ